MNSIGTTTPARIDLVISVCHKNDIDIWERAARHVMRWIPANRYQVIVPDGDLDLFIRRSPYVYECIPESRLSGWCQHTIQSRLSPSNLQRFGWYLQQFLKISALEQLRPDEVGLIWDADTVPLRHLEFIDRTGLIRHFVGSERHKPYFDCITRLLGLVPQQKESFIAQSLPIKGRWFSLFCQYIADRHHCDWRTALLNCIDFSEGTGFSEYETLGTFCAAHFPQEIQACFDPWERLGNSRIGGIDQLGTPRSMSLLRKKAFVSFEAWDAQAWRTLSRRRLRQFARHTWAGLRSSMTRYRDRRARKMSVASFLQHYFTDPNPKSVVQVGANDGVQSDPLRHWLERPGNYRATLIEPLPYYADRLRDLYQDRHDIRILQCACGARSGNAAVHFIQPSMAAQMNGDGPHNDWAHGQGSFDRAMVEHWIRANSFRGPEYRSRVEEFIQAIQSVQVKVVPVGDILEDRPNTLLCIDVQGSEIDVLRGVDWRNPPRFVMYEDDREAQEPIQQLLLGLGYRYLCGESDKVFELSHSS